MSHVYLKRRKAVFLEYGYEFLVEPERVERKDTRVYSHAFYGWYLRQRRQELGYSLIAQQEGVSPADEHIPDFPVRPQVFERFFHSCSLPRLDLDASTSRTREVE